VFGAGLRPLGPNHWVVPRIPQGELPTPTEDGNINDGLFIASFVKDDQGSLGLNVSEVSSVRGQTSFRCRCALGEVCGVWMLAAVWLRECHGIEARV
jgi:hypothetical protein